MSNIMDPRHLPMRLSSAIVFMCMFSFVGWAVPRTYFKYFDDRKYIVVTQPVSVDKPEYMACEKVLLTAKVSSEVNVTVSTLTQLVLVNEKGETYRVSESIKQDLPILARADQVIGGNLTLPCDIETGVYYWLGNLNYKVRGEDKNATFISETFIANQKANIKATAKPTPATSPSPTPQPQAGQIINVTHNETLQAQPSPTPRFFDDDITPICVILERLGF